MSELWLELSELTGSEKIFARARTGIGRELAITKRRLSNTKSFRCWLRVLKKSWFGSEGRDSLLVKKEQGDQGDDG